MVIIVLGISGEVFVRQRLIVANDAMATAANIRAHELLWRWSVATHAVGAVSVLDGLGALFPGVVVVMAATMFLIPKRTNELKLVGLPGFVAEVGMALWLLIKGLRPRATAEAGA